MPSFLQVSAAESTLTTDAATIEATTGLANITATFVDALGNPLVGATDVALGSTGTGNTITAISTRTSAVGEFVWTLASTVEEAKTLTASAGGLNVTQTVAVTVSGEAPAQVALIFASHWATATGTSDNAVLDESNAVPWDIRSAGLEVIVATDLDLPTTNCLRVEWGSADGQIVRHTGMGVIAEGSSRWYRWYERITIPNGTADNSQHPVQDGNAAPDCNWQHIIHNDVGGAGFYRVELWTAAGRTSVDLGKWDGPVLAKGVTYRHERQVNRVGATTYQVHARVYDDTGVLLYQDGDFVRHSTGVGTLADTPTITNLLAANTDGLNAGCNDHDESEPGYFGYHAGVAVSDEGWIGPYVSGEAPTRAVAGDPTLKLTDAQAERVLRAIYSPLMERDADLSDGLQMVFTVTGTNSLVLSKNTAPPGAAVSLTDIPYTIAGGEELAAGTAITESLIIYVKPEDAALDLYGVLAWTSGHVLVRTQPMALNQMTINLVGSPFSA